MESKCFFIHIFLLCTVFKANTVSLDGTAAVQYQAVSYPFANGDFARGFVRLNGGFSVPAGASISMNVVAPAAGAVNLNATGSVVLDGDLHLASNATLPSGGIFNGQGKAIFFDGNLTIPAGTVLSCSGDTIIDGQGHDLIFQNGTPGGQLLINGPAGTRVTLRNMNIHGLRTYANGTDAIAFGSGADQVLVLDNVTMHLNDIFFFSDGQMEIRNFVKISGFFPVQDRSDLIPTLFVYISPNDCTITRNSTLFIDTTIGFFYAPLDGSNKHLVLRRASSQLFLNGCSIFAPSNTGLELTKGHLIVDHKTQFQSDGIDGKAFRLGNGNKNSDTVLDILPGGKLECINALLQYQNQD